MVDSELIRKLRDSTGARMKDCVVAAKESGGDYDGAIAYLRKKNMANASKTADRAAEEGLIGHRISADGTSLSVVELTANTDFVVKNEEFLSLMNHLLELCEKSKATTAAALADKEIGGRPVNEVVKEFAGKIGENISIRRVERMSGSFGCYFHHDGKQGAAVELEGIDGEKAKAVGKDMAMHVVFAKPQYLRREDVPQEEVDRELKILAERLKEDPKNAKKPADILEKIATGQINKFFGQVALLDQPYYRPEVKKSVAEVLKEQVGANAKIKRFERFQIGGV